MPAFLRNPNQLYTPVKNYATFVLIYLLQLDEKEL